MHVTVSRRSLLDALDNARKFVCPPKESAPLAHACLLRATDSCLEVVRADLIDCQAVIEVDAAIHVRGEVGVSARALFRILKSSRSTAADLAAPKGEPLRVALENAVALLARVQPEEGTALERPAPAHPTSVARLAMRDLQWLLGSVLYAAGREENSSTDCIELSRARGCLFATATDGYRAASADVAAEDLGAGALIFYLPAATAAQLLRLKAEKMVELRLGSNKELELLVGRDTRLLCRTFDRTYPDLRSYMEKHTGGEPIVVRSEPLLSALERADAVLHNGAVVVPVELSGGDSELIVSGKDGSCGEVLEVLPAVASPAAGSLAINPSLAAECIAAIGASEVVLRLSRDAMFIAPGVGAQIGQRQAAVLMKMNLGADDKPPTPSPQHGSTPPAPKAAAKAKKSKARP